MNTILRRLASLRLTLALLFVLAALGALVWKESSPRARMTRPSVP